MNEQPKALSLVCGGLESLLATKVIQDQGVHVEGVDFFTGFCVAGHTQAIRKQDQAMPKRHNAPYVAEQLRFRLHIIGDYKQVVFDRAVRLRREPEPVPRLRDFYVRQGPPMVRRKRLRFRRSPSASASPWPFTRVATRPDHVAATHPRSSTATSTDRSSAKDNEGVSAGNGRHRIESLTVISWANTGRRALLAGKVHSKPLPAVLRSCCGAPAVSLSTSLN